MRIVLTLEWITYNVICFLPLKFSHKEKKSAFPYILLNSCFFLRASILKIVHRDTNKNEKIKTL